MTYPLANEPNSYPKIFTGTMSTISYFSKTTKNQLNLLKTKRYLQVKLRYLFDISALFMSIPAPVIPEVITRQFTKHINQTETEHFLENTCFIPKDKIISYFGIRMKQLCILLQGKILSTTSKCSNGSPSVSSQYQHLHGILWRNSPKPSMPHN